MSYNLKLNTATHDIVISRGTVRVEGINYIAQLTKTNLLLLYGEWDLDESLGIDWFNIMGKNYDLSIIQGIVADTIRSVEGVSDLISLTLDLDKSTRQLSINFSAIANGEVFTEAVTI